MKHSAKLTDCFVFEVLTAVTLKSKAFRDTMSRSSADLFEAFFMVEYLLGINFDTEDGDSMVL
jgi:hypothetical protein